MTAHSTSLTFNKPVPLTERNIHRHAVSAELIRDLDIVIDRGARNSVKFNVSKTESCSLSKKKLANPFPILVISSDMIMVFSAVAAGSKLGFLVRPSKYFLTTNLAQMG